MQVEKSFLRALGKISYHKWLCTFPVLVFCSACMVFFGTLSRGIGEWMAQSFIFLPILFSEVLLLALGLFLTKIYLQEQKGGGLRWRRILLTCLKQMLQVASLFLPLFLFYLLFWVGIGLFFLLGQLPGIGVILSVILSFIPSFLMVFSWTLCLLGGIILFVVPSWLLEEGGKVRLTKAHFLQRAQKSLSYLALMGLALLPFVLLSGVFWISTPLIPQVVFKASGEAVEAIATFFYTLPFCAVAAFCVVFFFQFAAESHELIHQNRPFKMGSCE